MSDTPAPPSSDQQECPGCGAMIKRGLIGCKPCYATIPGHLKQDFADTAPGSSARKRVVTKMRLHLSGAEPTQQQ